MRKSHVSHPWQIACSQVLPINIGNDTAVNVVMGFTHVCVLTASNTSLPRGYLSLSWKQHKASNCTLQCQPRTLPPNPHNNPTRCKLLHAPSTFPGADRPMGCSTVIPHTAVPPMGTAAAIPARSATSPGICPSHTCPGDPVNTPHRDDHEAACLPGAQQCIVQVSAR